LPSVELLISLLFVCDQPIHLRIIASTQLPQFLFRESAAQRRPEVKFDKNENDNNGTDRVCHVLSAGGH